MTDLEAARMLVVRAAQRYAVLLTFDGRNGDNFLAIKAELLRAIALVMEADDDTSTDKGSDRSWIGSEMEQ